MMSKQLDHKNKMEEIQLTGQFGVQQRDTGGRWLYESRKAEAAASVQRQEVKVDAQTQKIREETQAEMLLKHVDSNIEQQEADIDF
jgi:uncharacterized NAD-dependent epimerase/dehydratase family protein